MGETTIPCARNTWALWRDSTHPASLNMAVDELLFQQCPGFGYPVLRMYGWNEDAVSIGVFQRFDSAKGAAPVIVRRPTGGGLVRHDADLTFTVAAPLEDGFAGVHRKETYKIIHQAVLAALKRLDISAELAEGTKPSDPCAMVCFQAPVKDDVVVNAAKVAGGAQRRNAKAMLHQGSLNFTVAGLCVDRDKLESALIEGFSEYFQCDFTPFEHVDPVLSEAKILATDKYATEAWTRKH